MNDLQVTGPGMSVIPMDRTPDNNYVANWSTVDLPELKRDVNWFSGKDVVLATVTKDLITFLRLGVYYPDNGINVIAIFDMTLEYRPNVKKILVKTCKEVGLNVPIFTDLIKFRAFCYEYMFKVGSEEKMPTIIKFDHSGADDRQNRNVEEHFNSCLFNESSFERRIYDHYMLGCEAKKCGSNEFVYMMELRDKLILNSWLVHVCRLYIADCYGDIACLLVSEERDKTQEEIMNEKCWLASRTVRFNYNSLEPIEHDETVNLYELQNRTKNQKVRFVFSSDFGGGKMTYILSKDPYHYLSKDLFSSWFNPKSYYGPGGVQDYHVSESKYIFDALCRYELEGNIAPVYVKVEGRLDRYFFMFLRGGGAGVNPWQYFHLYFHDYEFHIVIKENEDLEKVARDIAIFAKVHLIDPSKIRVIKSINHCERFEEMDTERLLREHSTFYTGSVT